MPRLFLVAVAVAVAEFAACRPKHEPSLASTDSGAPRADTGGAPRDERDAAAAVDDPRCGYVDEAGRFAIPRRFQAAAGFASGVAAVVEHGKHGFIDASGAYAIAPAFDEAKSFHEGLAAVCVHDRGWGFIDSRGAWAIPPTLAAADSFSDGLAVIKDSPAEARFCDGLEQKEIPAGSECETNDGDDNDGGPGQYFLMDREGKRTNQKGYHCITRLSDGLAAVRWKDKWGYVDRDGKEVVPPQFKRAKPFGEGLAAVLVAPRTADPAPWGRWGFIDKRGRFVVPARFLADELGVFSEGLISIEGMATKAVMATAAGRAAVARRAKGKGHAMREMGEDGDDGDDGDGGEADGWAGYLDRKGTLRIAVPYCAFDDANPGSRSFREMSGGVAQVIMSEPASVAPFKCAPALMGYVTMFIDRRRSSYVEASPSLVSRGSSPGLAPKCGGDKPAEGVGRFVWE